MSAYELIDLRATHVEMVANFFKIWITATFAAVATAFFSARIWVCFSA